MLIHGVYHWRPKPVAFRNDYCIPCGAERVVIQVRTIDVWHTFWIPLVPLGAYRRWWCSECGRRPDLSRTARRSIKVLLAVVLAGLAGLMWFVPASSSDSGDTIVAWSMRLLFSSSFLAVLWWIAQGSDDVERRKRLPHIQPSQATECPLCKLSLQLTEPARCIKCGVIRARMAHSGTSARVWWSG
jgi:hypothetical protein